MFRFRLRTLLMIVALLAMPMAWVGYSLRWIRERREGGGLHPESTVIPIFPRAAPESTPAPGGLWIFGERGRYFVFARRGDKNRMARLFPESLVLEGDNLFELPLQR